MKKTLLQIVQDILSDMESDEVNSISDTVESMQVAQVVKTTYEALINDWSLPEHQRLRQLESLGDADRPNYLRVPSDVKDISRVSYMDETGKYKQLKYLHADQFLERQQVTDMLAVVDFSGVTLYCDDQRDPQFYTTFDDDYLVFDGYDSNTENTLQSSKSLVYAVVIPEFDLVDDFVADLSAHMFPLFISKAKSKCFINFKQVTNNEEAADGRRHSVRQQSRLWRAGERDYRRLPDFGRRRR